MLAAKECETILENILAALAERHVSVDGFEPDQLRSRHLNGHRLNGQDLQGMLFSALDIHSQSIRPLS